MCHIVNLVTQIIGERKYLSFCIFRCACPYIKLDGLLGKGASGITRGPMLSQRNNTRSGSRLWKHANSHVSDATRQYRPERGPGRQLFAARPHGGQVLVLRFGICYICGFWKALDCFLRPLGRLLEGCGTSLEGSGKALGGFEEASWIKGRNC